MRVDYGGGEYIITGKCKCGNMLLEFIDKHSTQNHLKDLKKCIVCNEKKENKEM